MASRHIKLIQSVKNEADGSEVIITYGFPVCMIPSKLFMQATEAQATVDWPIQADCPTCIIRATLNGLG